MIDQASAETGPLPLSDEELSAFRKRRTALNAGILLMVLPVAAMYLAPGWAEGKTWLYQGYVALTSILLVAFLAGWRCPRCRVILFGQMNPKFCPRCGVRFSKDAGS